MPGKRPRPIRRTTSVSQLSSRLHPPSRLSVASPPPPPPSTPPLQQPPHTTLQSPYPLPFPSDAFAPCASAMHEPRLDTPEICPLNAPSDETMGTNVDASSAAGGEMMQNGSSMMCVDDADALKMALDSFSESQSVSPSDGLSGRFRSADSPSFTPSGSTVINTSSEPSDSIRPVGFLDLCFHCKRRLRAGRDIFMYRGDRAFCSIECRYHQMAADERKEKCAVSAAKKGSASAVTTNTGNQVGPAETAAAA